MERNGKTTNLYDLALLEGKLLYSSIRVRRHWQGVIVKHGHKDSGQVLWLRLIVVWRPPVTSSITIWNTGEGKLLLHTETKGHLKPKSGWENDIQYAAIWLYYVPFLPKVRLHIKTYHKLIKMLITLDTYACSLWSGAQHTSGIIHKHTENRRMQ